MKLLTLDLFSGIGGMSLALRPVCKTVAYCEIDPLCVNILEGNMLKGDLEKGPILGDVSNLDMVALNALAPQMITAGFPCQDISTVNHRGKGLRGPKSGLFFQIMNVIDHVPSIKCVLLENSANILNKGISVLKKEFTKRKWTIVWSVFTASEVGRPHLRRRWVALACAPGFVPPHLEISKAKMYKEPTRVVLSQSVAKRCGTLGNSVVPQCMAFAFKVLCDIITKRTGLSSKHTNSSHMLVGGTMKGYRVQQSKCPSQELVFKGNDHELIRKYWITPIKSPDFWHKYINLNNTFINFLPCQVVHEVNTITQIEALVGRLDKTAVSINPRFVEWLMGYPKDWTLT